MVDIFKKKARDKQPSLSCEYVPCDGCGDRTHIDKLLECKKCEYLWFCSNCIEDKKCKRCRGER